MATHEETQPEREQGDQIEAQIGNVSGDAQVAVGKNITQLHAGRDLYSAETINIIYQQARVDPATVRERLSFGVCVQLLEGFRTQLDQATLPLESKALVAADGLQVVYYQGEKLNAVEVRPAKIKRLQDQIQLEIEAYRQSCLDSELDPQDPSKQEVVAAHTRILTQQIAQAQAILQTALIRFQHIKDVPAAPVAKDARLLPQYPYKFLDSFEEKDAAIFFGRELETKDLLSQVLAHPLTILYAKSGTGKTSLLKAGIIPELAQEGDLAVYVRILKDPFTEVRQALNSCLHHPLEISQDTDLHDFLALINKREKRSLVLILDQFEEFFIRLSPSIQESFIAQLASIYYAINLSVHLVISIREDFLGELSKMEGDIPPILNNRFHLQPLTDKQAREAIEEPVKLYKVSYEDGLLDLMLSELSHEGVAPPQLQIVCNKLWNKLGSGETVITHEMYQRAGGTREILAGYVTEVLAAFDKDRRKVARAILKEMVTSQQTRTLLDLHKFQETFATKFSPEIVEQVLQRLINRRLVRSIEREDMLYYELAHEYLIEKIRDWFDEEEVKFKKAQEMLERALADYGYSGALMPRSHIKIVEQYRDRLVWSSTVEDLLQQSKKRIKYTLLRLIVLVVILLSLASVPTYLLYQDYIYKRNKMGLFPEVSNPANAELSLYRIKENGLSKKVEEFTGKKIFLTKGDYYLEAKKGDWTIKYPVYIEGYSFKANPVEITIPEGLSIPEDMVYIPPGWFRMGNKEGQGNANENPAHDVKIDAFLMDKKEVSYSEYIKFIDNGGYQNKSLWPPEKWDWLSKLQKLDSTPHPNQWSNGSASGVTWYQAYAYCTWTEKQLPTEAEWEKAARGPEGYLYAYGNIYDEAKIDTEKPNGYGLYYITGGVGEWVSDWYGADYYQSSPDTNPKGPSEGKYRVVRGGSSADKGDYTRIPYRWYYEPDQNPPTVGFRCIKRISPK